MPDHRQRKLAKQKRKRGHVGRAGVSYNSQNTVSQAEKRLAAQLPELPLGPCFITRGWRDPSAPRLQCIVATRHLDENTLVPAAILVDLGCQGVRDAYFAKPTAIAAMPELLSVMQTVFPRGFQEIPPKTASTIVQRAVEYAGEIGLEIPEKAKPALRVLTEEQDPMLDLELGRGGKPLYTPQPGEDMRPMVKRLVQAVGPDGFEVILPSPPERSTES